MVVTQVQKKELEQISRAATSSQREAQRARIILGLSAGMKAREVGTSMPSVSKWRGRWNRAGLVGLQDAAGRGRKPSVSAKAVGKAPSLAPTRAAHGGAWSVREMAAHTGLSKLSVQRLWAAQGIAPHRVRGFKLSQDQQFEEKYWDVVGLYLNPPRNAVVLCCDEKSQCQALERTQTGLPLGRGTSARAPTTTIGTAR
jgi:transposase